MKLNVPGQSFARKYLIVANWLHGIRISPVLCRYMIETTLGNLAWEVLQLPFYSLWKEGSANEIFFAVAHCTLGDVLITAVCVSVALFILGRDNSLRNMWRLAAIVVPLGVGYLIFSEWLNVSVRENWEYAATMPTVPGLGTGLFPLMQWIVVPLVGFWSISRGRANA